MLTGHFEVGKDDHPVGLTYEEIDFMVQTILSKDTSPLSLNFRILPDLSALKQDTHNLQPLKKDGFWIYRKLYNLTCYNSLKYRGSGSTLKYDNYITGSKLWCISAMYGYEISEAESIPDSNKPFIRKGRHVYYRTEQPGKKYELKYIDIEDSSNRLDDFLSFYSQLNVELSKAKTWIDHKFDFDVTCDCGHNGKIDHFRLLNKLNRVHEIISLKPQLRCNSCGDNSSVTLMPLYGEHTPKELFHKTAFVEFEKKIRKFSHYSRNTELSNMYNSLGGDGESPIYLSDGAFLSPNGEISED